ncbi:photosystem reaction center subunit H [Anaerobacillus arseniciselenatis]|uniref:Photosystem reaction center subunit H n=1 Tax=Anaerobacillus arseniciselenatis TaxID=85682 RepID=A0A1S2LEZ3_9BACI|nr:PRC-barrel domain-containing protein [Anaerobacillus arseniciselenatis]OIJ10287.1 photosystem reaction center subunit H [Anaerobacillus arseniciselenatis]
MKTSKQIVGLPIISINDGKELGTVKSLVVNPEHGTIDFITVHHEDWQISVKAVPFKKVIGVGDFAVTIESETNIIDLTEIPIANTLVTKNIKINGARIMSKKGQLLGKVDEYFINEDNGSIIALQLNVAKDEEVVLASEHVHTFGKDILIVNEDANEYFLNNIEELFNGKKIEEEKIPSVEDATEEVAVEKEEEEDISQAFLERQITLLEGKKVTSDIYNKSGELLIKNGTELTKDLILAVHNDGPSGMVELSMNVEE